MNNREDVLNFLRSNKDILLSEYSLTKIGIFGSYARNEQTENSDIDIILDFETDLDDIYGTKYDLREYLKSVFKKEVDICTERAIKPIFKPFILRDAIYV
jgi:uncharacterized protein